MVKVNRVKPYAPVRRSNDVFKYKATSSSGVPGPSGDTGNIVSLGNVSGTLNLTSYTVGSQLFTATVNGELTITVSSMPATLSGMTGSFSLMLTKDATTTGRAVTLDANFKASYGNKPTFSGATANTAGIVDIWTFLWDGTNWNVLVTGTDLR